MLFVSQPNYGNYGRIIVYELYHGSDTTRDPFQLIYILNGHETARNVGKTLDLRHKTTAFGMEIYEVFYDNWQEFNGY